MSDRHVSGVPVVDDSGRILGVVSQSDLLRRAELGTERKRRPWLEIFSSPDNLAREYAKSHGKTAAEVMTRHVVSVRDDTEVREVADVLEKHKIKRVPVVRDGKLVGIITRSDIVRTLARLPAGKQHAPLEDGIIQKAILGKMKAQPWLDASHINLIVRDGEVELWGAVDSKPQREALEVLVREVPGVKSVKDNLAIGIPGMTGL
jgi:CBS-domain-containing membrane protein